MNSTHLTSPCYNRSPIDGTHSLRELPLAGKLNIRGDAGNPEFIEAIRKTLKLDLPVIPNSVSEGSSSSLFWLGPDEWLLYCELDEVATVSSDLQSGLADMHCAVTEVSDYYTVLRLNSPDAGALIRNGCPLDIHHSVFKPNQIAQTRFGHASILLRKQGEEHTWDIQVRWTYAEYVWDYLVSGMSTIQGEPNTPSG